MRKVLAVLTVGFLCIGCSTARRQVHKSTSNAITSSFFDTQFTGILMVDAQSKDTLYNYNSTKYFTPASNTKIFTLFTSLSVLPDSLPGLKYLTKNDTLYIEGTGDPTLLHPYFDTSNTLDFLKGYSNIAIHYNNFHEAHYAPGWSWEDYGYYFQPERTALPIYGNVVSLHQKNGLQATPLYFKDSVLSISYKANRAIDRNKFYFSPSRKDSVEIPFKTSNELTTKLLQDYLQQPISITSAMPNNDKKVLFSIDADTVYRRMMIESDNFLAEQLLIQSSTMLSDTLSSQKARNYILENQLHDLKQKPRWVDGSGLSRYNLFTPESMVHVLSKLYETIPQQRLFGFFPVGGNSGTLENWYGGNSKPYIYAKSGSLGNIYCLSGYLKTKSGKTVVFSFMNNHFTKSSAQVKQQMQKIFEEIRDTY